MININHSPFLTAKKCTKYQFHHYETVLSLKPITTKEKSVEQEHQTSHNTAKD